MAALIVSSNLYLLTSNCILVDCSTTIIEKAWMSIQVSR